MTKNNHYVFTSRFIPVNITKQYDVGCYLARFTPQEVGDHKITVKVGSSVVPGSPFTCQVGDHTKVTFQRKGKSSIYNKRINEEILTSPSYYFSHLVTIAAYCVHHSYADISTMPFH